MKDCMAAWVVRGSRSPAPCAEKKGFNATLRGNAWDAQEPRATPNHPAGCARPLRRIQAGDAAAVRTRVRGGGGRRDVRADRAGGWARLRGEWVSHLLEPPVLRHRPCARIQNLRCRSHTTRTAAKVAQECAGKRKHLVLLYSHLAREGTRSTNNAPARASRTAASVSPPHTKLASARPG
jgi:hypothetical protein